MPRPSPKARQSKPPHPEKVEKVLHEFKAGTLRSSSGQKVTSKAQALAIALSEARRGKTR